MREGERVWFLMLKGHSPQSIIKTLHTTQTVTYNDIKFLTERGRKYVFDMAKRGLHVLLYQRAIEGIGLTLSSPINSMTKFYLRNKRFVTRDRRESHSAII